MAIVFTCDKCGKQLSVSEEFAGKKARCPGCNATITVPVDSLRGQEPAPGTAYGASAKIGASLLDGGIKTVLPTLAKFAIPVGVAIMLLISLINGIMVAGVMGVQAEISELRKESKEPPLRSDYSSGEEFSGALKTYQERVKESEKKREDLEKDRDARGRALLGSMTWRVVLLVLAYLLAFGGCTGLFLLGSESERQCGIIGMLLLVISMAFTLPPTLLSMFSLFSLQG